MRQKKEMSEKRVASQPAVTGALSLLYVDDSMPGIRRQRCGRGFRYVASTGETVRTTAIILRIQSLVIPPAWTDVWICEKEWGHLQATGRDARGRKQCLYHASWRQFRDEAKYDKLVDFAKALPKIRQRVAIDLRRRGLPREKVLAAIVRLMENSLIRIGNAEYARENQSYGLTTMRDHHAHVQGSRICFDFRGKSGIQHVIELHDERLAKIVRECQSLPGQELFQYRDSDDVVRDVGSADVNDYLREISGGDFTAKDFRTWGGSSLAAKWLLTFEAFESEAAARRNIVQAISNVSKQLGNTVAVCRKSYIHPAVIASYLDRTLASVIPHSIRDTEQSTNRLSRHERGLLRLLKSAFTSRASTSALRQRVSKRLSRTKAIRQNGRRGPKLCAPPS